MSSPTLPQHPPSTGTAEGEDEEDIFSSVLNLEESYYETGYADGLAHGTQLGRLEGRVYGLERGFEKYLTLGNVSGRTKVWHARTTLQNSSSLPQISNPRHIRHVTALQSLTDSPPIRNEDEDVEDVDDRLRRCVGKRKVLSMALGERGLDEGEVKVGGGLGRNEV